MNQRLSIGEICTRDVVFVTEDTSLKDAANLMRTEHVGSLVVVRETSAGRLVTGMLTDRDIAIVAVAREFDPQTLRTGDIMSEQLVIAHPEDSVYDTLATMRQKGVRRVPVVDAKGMLQGIASMDDVLEVITEELQMLVQAMARQRLHEEKVKV